MKMSYNKLWKLLIDKQMKKSDLRKKAGISSSSLAKLTKDEKVTTEVLSKICQELKCDVADIMEFVPDPTPINRTRQARENKSLPIKKKNDEETICQR